MPRINALTEQELQDRQLKMEHRYSKQFIDVDVDRVIRETPAYETKVQEGIALLQEWLSADWSGSYGNKTERLAQISGFDLDSIVRGVFIESAYCVTPELFTSFTAKMAGRLNMSEKKEAITTIAEIVAVLEEMGLYELSKAERSASIMLRTHMQMPDDLIAHANQTRYLPPMLCKPKTLTNNYQSAYLTEKGGVVLGRGKNHAGNVALDVMNHQNQVPYRLDVDLLKAIEEEKELLSFEDFKKKHPGMPDHDVKKLHVMIHENWDMLKAQSYELYVEMVKQGNRFYLTHRPDNRGRVYAQGYHISTQGSGFKKAIVELAEEEVVEGPIPSVV